jgi:hypothetical protein
MGHFMGKMSKITWMVTIGVILMDWKPPEFFSPIVFNIFLVGGLNA